MVTRFRAVLALGFATVAVVACTASPGAAPPVNQPPPPPPVVTQPVGAGPVMGPSLVSAVQLTSWFDSKGIVGARPTVTVAELAAMFISEGNREGVTGDVAFVQAILETGWLRFPDTGRVRPTDNNFAGIGAVDGGSSAATFPDARTGVRAQIQHLRAYADPTASVATLHAPLVDPRFSLVSPKGKAPLWSQFGSGIWATDPAYASKIETLYADLRRHAGV